MEKKRTEIPFSGELTLEIDDDSKEQNHQQGEKSVFAENESKKALYTGPDHRKRERRQQHDRRGDLRFEEKTDRRSGIDRRQDAWDQHYNE